MHKTFVANIASFSYFESINLGSGDAEGVSIYKTNCVTSVYLRNAFRMREAKKRMGCYWQWWGWGTEVAGGKHPSDIQFPLYGMVTEYTLQYLSRY